MSSFFDQRAQEMQSAASDYQNNINSITQQNLMSKISNIGMTKESQNITTQTLASGMEAKLSDALSEHMNKFADEMGLDLSLPGVGKPVLSYASRKIKGYAADRAKRLKAQQGEQQAAKDPEGIRTAQPEVAADEGTELSTFKPSTESRASGDLPEARPTRAVDEAQQEREADAEPVDDEPPVEARAPVAERSTAPTEQTQRPTLEQNAGETQELGPMQPMEVDATLPGSQPLAPRPRPAELDADTDAISALPEELGWKNGINVGGGDPLRGPGEMPATEPINPASASYNELNRVPQMGRGTATYSDERLENPFRFQGSEFDPSRLTKGPPADLPEPPNVSFQYQAPTQSEAEAARGIARGEASGGEGLIQPKAIQQGRIVPEGAGAGDQEARDQLAKALGGRGRGGGAGPDDPAVPQEPVAGPAPEAIPRPPPRDAPGGPDYQSTGGRFADTGTSAPPPPPRDAPGGPDYQPPPPRSDPLQQTSGENAEFSNAVKEGSDMSEQLAKDSADAADQLASKTTALTADSEAVGKGLFEKASSALGEITGSDILGGFGSFLGIAGDFLGPILGGVGLFEAAKGIAESQNQAGQDPYAKVKALIAQGQAKMAGLDSDISADQFAEKVAGTKAPAFGSLAAPVFSTQGLTGMSQHF